MKVCDYYNARGMIFVSKGINYLECIDHNNVGRERVIVFYSVVNRLLEDVVKDTRFLLILVNLS